MKTGDIWQQPYRGSRYSFHSDGIYYRIPTFKHKVYAKGFSQDLLDNLLDINPFGGTFRITETGKVITKVMGNGRSYPYYVCDYDWSLIFSEINLTPGKELISGDIWTGFYYLHGARFSLSYYDEIFWRSRYGRRHYLISDNMDLIEKLRPYRPRGGRFYITENGKVWTNAEHLLNWRRAEGQIRNFTNIQKNLLQLRTDSTKLYPVYVCEYDKPLIIDLDDFKLDYSEDVDIDIYVDY